MNQELAQLPAPPPIFAHSSAMFLRRVYGVIVLLALGLHIAYMILFGMLRQPMLAATQVASITIYIFIAYLIRRGFFRIAFALVQLEVMAFVLVSVTQLGWSYAFQFWLISISALVFLTPYRRRTSAIGFLVCNTVVFVGLYLYCGQVTLSPAQMLTSLHAQKLIYVGNTLACFFVIMLAWWLSRTATEIVHRGLVAENQELENLAQHDSLTGLPNRRAMNDMLIEAWQDQRNVEHPIAVVMGDIDNFKAFNDIYGHDVGDHVLREVAQTLRCCFRAQDRVARWGGEEFLILLTYTDDENARAIVERVRAEVEAMQVIYDGKSLQVTMTFGVYTCFRDMSFDEAIQNADTLLYAGKKAGKNCVKTKI